MRRVSLGIAALLVGSLVGADGVRAQSGPTTEQIIEALDPEPPFQMTFRGVRPIRKSDTAASSMATPASARSIDLEVPFNFDSDVLTDTGKALLDRLGAALSDERLKRYRFRLVGHTDAVGSAGYNQTLSERRARAVRVYLAEKYQVSEARLESLGLGKSQLRDPANPTSAINRRVQVINLGAAPE